MLRVFWNRLFRRVRRALFLPHHERKRLHDDCATEAVYRDPSRLKEIGRRIAELETELIAAYAEWEDFAERL